VTKENAMAIEFDEKGKYFTEVISKNVVLSHIQTQAYRIQGYVHVRQGERLSDEINSANNFLAVTKAEVYNLQGEIIYSNDFLIVNRAHIEWLMPIDENPVLAE
jgi:Family of unknown function (DUF6812)